jgi:DNA sulfur modification protein DndB
MAEEREENLWEDNIRKLMVSLGFKEMLSWKKIPGEKRAFQVDASGGCDDKYLIIDATISEDPSYKYGNIDEFNERRKEIIKKVNTKYENYKDIVFIIWLNTKGAADKIREKASKEKILILTRNDYDLFNKRINTLEKLNISGRAQKLILRYWLLKILNLDLPLIEDIDLFHVPAIKFCYSKKYFAYNFVMSPEVLLRACFVWRREITGEEGYQRILNENRIVDIKQFIENKKSTFPNNIIINYEDGDIEEIKCEPTKSKSVYNCIIKLPQKYCSAQIIDGQHRLYGFMDIENEFIRHNLKMDVIAFNGLTRKESAEIFIELNKEQKKIDPNLFWDLAGDYLKETYEGQISLIAKSLNEKGIFKGRILIPGGKKSEKATIKIANLCKGIDDRGLIYNPEKKYRDEYRWNLCFRGNKNDITIREITIKQMDLYFKMLKEELPEIWESFIFANNGLNVFLRIFVEALKFIRHNLNKTNIKIIIRPLALYLSKKSIHEKEKYLKETSSEGGRAEIANEFMAVINKKIKRFAKYHLETISLKVRRDEAILEIENLEDEIISYRRNTRNKERLYKKIINKYAKIEKKSKIAEWAERMIKDFPGSRFAHRYL